MPVAGEKRTFARPLGASTLLEASILQYNVSEAKTNTLSRITVDKFWPLHLLLRAFVAGPRVPPIAEQIAACFPVVIC